MGVMLFELLVGERSFRGSSAMILHQVVHAEPPKLRSLNNKIPADSETIVAKCMEKNPASRSQTAKELAEDLRRHLKDEPIKARPIGRWERSVRWCRRNPGLARSAAAITLILLIALGLVSWSWRREHAARLAADKSGQDALQRYREANRAVDVWLTETTARRVESRLLDSGLWFSDNSYMESHMNAKDAIRSSVNVSSMVLKTYLSDLDDADLMRRPGEGCNHLAWQLGHLISSEVFLLEKVSPGTAAALPDGFSAAHSKENCDKDDAADFLKKADYIELFDEVRAASVAALDAYPDADLDKEAPEEFRTFCPTMGDMFTLIATHPMMHAGQFVVVRRQLGKPILM